MRHEDAARTKIDSLLAVCGWDAQYFPRLDRSSLGGNAMRKFPLESSHGFADHLLYVNRRAVGVVEVIEATAEAGLRQAVLQKAFGGGTEYVVS